MLTKIHQGGVKIKFCWKYIRYEMQCEIASQGLAIRLPHFAKMFYFCALLRGIIAQKVLSPRLRSDTKNIGRRLIKMLCEEVG